MGREIKRVPLDFEHALKEVWPGFLMPDTLNENKCRACDETGYSRHAWLLQSRWYGYVPFNPTETGSTPYTPYTPALRAFAERNVGRSPDFYQDWMGGAAVTSEARRLADLFNGQWSHHLSQEDVNALVEGGRLYDFTHTWVKGDGWTPKNPPPVITAEQVNTWSISGGFGHDSINAWTVIRAACERAGQPYECGDCDGHGSHEAYAGQRADAETWEPTGPPEGDGWQLWETVSEGSPISPVFDSAEALAVWMTQNNCTVNGPARSVAAAMKFIEARWAPSFISTPATGVLDGVTAAGLAADDEPAEVAP